MVRLVSHLVEVLFAIVVYMYIFELHNVSPLKLWVATPGGEGGGGCNKVTELSRV